MWHPNHDNHYTCIVTLRLHSTSATIYYTMFVYQNMIIFVCYGKLTFTVIILVNKKLINFWMKKNVFINPMTCPKLYIWFGTMKIFFRPIKKEEQQTVLNSIQNDLYIQNRWSVFFFQFGLISIWYDDIILGSLTKGTVLRFLSSPYYTIGWRSKKENFFVRMFLKILFRAKQNKRK